MLNNLSRSKKQALSKYTKVFLVVALIGVGVYFVTQRNQESDVLGTTDTAESSELAPPVASIDIGKSFSVPLIDESGTEFSALDYTIESADLRDEIIVQGEKARAVTGRKFLIINIKITNPSESGVEVNTRNYLRLATNADSQDWLAPDIHNDPVEVQAIATKRTRVGFPVNDTDTNINLQVGEIAGEKEVIQLSF